MDSDFTEDDVGFDDDNHAVPVAVFDFDEIDGEAGQLADEIGVTPATAKRALQWLRRRESQDTFRQAADFLARLCGRMIPSEGYIRTELLGARLLALGWLLNRGGESLTSLAARARISKQLAHHHVRQLQMEIGGGFHGHQQKRAESSISYRIAQQEVWGRLTPSERKARRRGKKKTAPSLPEAVSDVVASA